MPFCTFFLLKFNSLLISLTFISKRNFNYNFLCSCQSSIPCYRRSLRVSSMFFSFKPRNKKLLVGSNGLEPSTVWFKRFFKSQTVRKVIHSSRATGSCWWAQMDSNHRPHAYQACALTNWAMSPCLVEINGFEPLTPCLQGRCSSQLSYTPASSNHKVFVLPSSRGTLYITNAPPFTPEHSLQLKIW